MILFSFFLYIIYSSKFMSMKLNLAILMIWIIILGTIILKIWVESNVADIDNKRRPGKKSKPQLPASNDKIVIVKYIELSDMSQAIRQFCNLYNRKKFIALPRLVMEDYSFVITFPFNIEFENFCYFVNYLGNPHDLCNYSDYQPNVRAWCTTQPVDSWLTDEITNKKVMLFIPESEIKQDRMYLATNDNLGYKMSVLQGELLVKPDSPRVKYENIPVDLNLLKDRKYIDF